jgi:hypothetical protein
MFSNFLTQLRDRSPGAPELIGVDANHWPSDTIVSPVSTALRPVVDSPNKYPIGVASRPHPDRVVLPAICSSDYLRN